MSLLKEDYLGERIGRRWVLYQRVCDQSVVLNLCFCFLSSNIYTFASGASQ
jgi:hypothetical protein